MPRAYYNEIDAFAAAWLRELIRDGLIADGDVDTRSIEDVCSADLVGYTQCHFFAGIGGWSYALRLAGWPDDREVWTGSCPCQPYSQAGAGLGNDDPRALWWAFRWLIRESNPVCVFGEQVASADGRLWLAGVHTDLEALGYRFGAADLCAAGIGLPHRRQRLYWVADAANADGRPGKCGTEAGIGPYGVGRRVLGERGADHWMGNSSGAGLQERNHIAGVSPGPAGPGAGEAVVLGSSWRHTTAIACTDGKVRRIPSEPALFPVVDGIPSNSMGFLHGAGNAIVPPLAAQFIRAYDEVRSA